jgi:hypothetical protein
MNVEARWSRSKYIFVGGIFAGLFSAPCFLLAAIASFSSTNPWGRVALILLAVCGAGAIIGSIAHRWQTHLLVMGLCTCGAVLSGVLSTVFIFATYFPTHNAAGYYIPVSEQVWHLRIIGFIITFSITTLISGVLLLILSQWLRRQIKFKMSQ